MARNGEQLEAVEDPLESDSASDAELLPSPKGRRTMPSLAYSIAIGLACAVGLVTLTAMVAHSDFTPRGHSARAAPRALTVRSLLEGHELAEVATNNILAIGGATTSEGKPMEHEEVKGKVQESFGNIMKLIKEKNPEAMEKLDKLKLTDEQKEKAMKLVHKFGDARMVKLTQEVKAAVEEHKKEGGDDAALKDKVARRLLPHMGDLRSLAQEILPGSEKGSVDIPVNKGGWKGDLEVDFGRRLSVSEVETVGGVTAQARSLFQGLESELGDDMPKAPSRILFSLSDDTFSTAPTGASSAAPATKPSFMDCLSKALPNPIEVCSCIASNMSEVMSMMMSFMKGGSSGSTR